MGLKQESLDSVAEDIICIPWGPKDGDCPICNLILYCGVWLCFDAHTKEFCGMEFEKTGFKVFY